MAARDLAQTCVDDFAAGRVSDDGIPWRDHTPRAYKVWDAAEEAGAALADLTDYSEILTCIEDALESDEDRSRAVA